MLYLIFPDKDLDTVRKMVPSYKQISKISENNMYAIPYAYTTSKRLKNQFLEFRDKKKYSVKKWKIRKKDFTNFIRNQQYDTLEIVEAKLKYQRDYETVVPITLNEYIGSTDELSPNYEDHVARLFNADNTFDYSLMKSEKHVRALDALNYTNYYDLIVGGDPRIESEENREQRRDDAEQMMCAGVSMIYGYPFRSMGSSQESLHAFLLFYSFAL